MSEPLRLNLGAGSLALPGYTNVDAGYPDCTAASDPQPDGIRRVRAEAFPLPFADESVAELRASHLLEHYSHRQVPGVLREWIRVLQPGGVLKVAVPDFDAIIEAYQSGEPHPIEGWIMGGHVDDRDHHGALFNRDALAGALEIFGLVDIQEWESELRDCAALPISLNLMGRKPGGEAIEPVLVPEARAEAPEPPAVPVADLHFPPGAVRAVMSAPRLGFLDTMHCVYAALGPLGIQLLRGGGAFWHQSLTDMLERSLEDGAARYILTLDYDTVFAQADVLQLLRLMETRPEIDFLCSLQARRGKESPLLTMHTDEPHSCGPREIKISRETLAQDTMPIASGHFGLTVLRVSSLAKLPRPWFVGVPDADGGYGDGRVDADIFFWKQANEVGLSTHVANRVVVGHLELMVSWPDQQLRNRHQHAQEWNDTGKPGWAWR